MNPHDLTLATSKNTVSDVAEERLARLLEEYLCSLEAGQPLDPQELMEAHPDLAGPLQECLSGLRLVHEAVQAEPKQNQRKAGLPFDRLGDYELLREIGRGGMGVVYEARQISLNRRVALKILPFPALLDEKQIARFSNEARAAAQLQHAHIVPVFSVGSEGGVHFFSMQYIDGEPLSQLIRRLRGEPPCDPEAVTVAESRKSEPPGRAHWRRVAELGIQAAEALHYAHQCGVVHRDIKPSNLLLDVEGNLWVADFGLARCRADSSLTTSGGLLGTVHYMSPEQAGQGEPVDHRSDIYSLGITLYELATLREAFPGGERAELLRRILHDLPVRPRKVQPSMPLDLETILLKATAQSPRERYASAQQLAEDLERFLQGRPILAMRASAADRALKWAARHKVIVVSALAVGLLAMVGMMVATTLIAAAQATTRDALAKAKVALAEKDDALRLSEKNRQRSEQWFHQTRDVLNRLAQRQGEELRSLPEADTLRQELLRDSIHYYRSFIRGAEDDPALRSDLAVAQFQTGKLLERLPEPREALEAYRKAQATLERLAAERIEDLPLQADLALCQNNIGLLLLGMGSVDEAHEALTRGVQIQRRLVEQAPEMRRFPYELALSLGNLGAVCQRREDRPAAEAAYEESRDLCQALTQQCPGETRYVGQLALAANDLGLLIGESDLERAEALERQALTSQQTLVHLVPKDSEAQADLALCQTNLAALLRRREKFDEAQACYQEALAVYRRLAQTAPAIGRYRCELATACSNLGALELQRGRHESARQSFHEAREVLSRLVREVPAVVNYRSYLGGVLSNEGTALARLGRRSEAEEAYRQGIDEQRWAVEHAPQATSFRRLLAGQYRILGRFLREHNRAEEGRSAELAAADLLRSPGEKVKLVKEQR